MVASADPETLADANDAATTLLLLYEALGIRALVITLEEHALYVRCQNSEDVMPLIDKVAKEYEAPVNRALN